ncbi:MAG: hypothetical protein ABFR31_08970 [Thermodesulfobacteriota bacterium]
MGIKKRREFARNVQCLKMMIRKEPPLQGQAISLGSDSLVIGRFIREASDPAHAAQKVIKEIED